MTRRARPDLHAPAGLAADALSELSYDAPYLEINELQRRELILLVGQWLASVVATQPKKET